MAEWFETKVKFLRQMDNGLIKQITEQYLVDSMSFTEAEGRVMTEVGEGMREVTVVSIKRSAIKETVMYGDTDMFFKVKVVYELMDEETEKAKKVNIYLLVNANDAKEAYERTEEHLKEMLVPFSIVSIAESPIIEVYQYEKGLRPGLRRMPANEAQKTFSSLAAKHGMEISMTNADGEGIKFKVDGSVERAGGEFDMEDAGDFAESGRVNNPNESVIDCAYTKQEPHNQELFNLLDKHGYIALQSEMEQIMSKAETESDKFLFCDWLYGFTDGKVKTADAMLVSDFLRQPRQ